MHSSKTTASAEEVAAAKFRRLQNLPLPAPIVPQLGSAAVSEWRQAYRRNRLGEARGASGEGKDLLTRFKSLAHQKKILRTQSVVAPDPDDDDHDDHDHDGAQAAASRQGDVKAGAAAAAGAASTAVTTSVGEEDEWESLEQAQALITEYRLAYRRHRMGDSVGAKGELGDLIRAMDASTLRLLPAAQIASLYATSSQLSPQGMPRSVSSGLLGELQDCRLHVHFGAGRLGLGLVIPAVAASGVPFAVVQRPSEAFKALLTDKEGSSLKEGEKGGGTQGGDGDGGGEEAPKSLDVLLTVNGDTYLGSSLAFVGCVSELPPLWFEWLKTRRDAQLAAVAAATASSSSASPSSASSNSSNLNSMARSRSSTSLAAQAQEQAEVERREGEGATKTAVEGAGGATTATATAAITAAAVGTAAAAAAAVTMRRELVAPPSGLTPRGLFVCSGDPELVSLVTAGASSFSTSLGPGIAPLAKVLSESMFPRCEPTTSHAMPCRPALFAGENDHSAVDDLAEQLEGRVDVVSCMVDRICTGRDVTGTPQREVAVRAEPYGGSLVVLTPPRHVPSPPFEGSHVLVPRSRAEADYLCRRKLLLVNGSHTTLAFLTLVASAAGTLPPSSTSPSTSVTTVSKPFVVLKDDKLTGACAELELVTLRTATPEQTTMIEAWAVARLLVLLFEWDLQVIKAAHGVESDEQVAAVLVGFAKETLNRFSTTSDTTGRILGGGVCARFRGRLEPVLTFLKDTTTSTAAPTTSTTATATATTATATAPSSTAKGQTPSKAKKGSRPTLASLVLEKYGMDLATVRRCVEALTNDARKFTGQDAPPQNA
eukprot:CAMPEP_0171932310 /NCGR_PEP_ID=MMETSP0993-20121228/30267_1 /TAXON_ID=483369 /ORGANISM="non described non described, Strain CCMP2098" /LENGTH=826 /DNA_ID=CAMNT_0012572565 /DNA_START=46 /DNA_END=2526 /DNA_ORIENTATION=-